MYRISHCKPGRLSTVFSLLSLLRLHNLPLLLPPARLLLRSRYYPKAYRRGQKLYCQIFLIVNCPYIYTVAKVVDFWNTDDAIKKIKRKKATGRFLKTKPPGFGLFNGKRKIRKTTYAKTVKNASIYRLFFSIFE